MSERADVVVVGAGHAGGRAVEALRGAGFAGTVTLIGAEPHLPYERPFLSKELLAGACDFASGLVRPAEFYDANRIDVRLSTRVTSIDRDANTIRLDGGSTLGYGRLLLTTGARARRLPIPGGSGRSMHYLRDADDCSALRDSLTPGTRVAIVGAGFIGLEVASTAIGLGCSVAVFEAAGHPLGRAVAPEIGEFYAVLHRKNGVTLRCGASIGALEESGNAVVLELADGERIEADAVLVGIGAQPNVELAVQAGLAVDDGIVVDEFGQTADPAIYAAGDVTRHYNPLLKRYIRLEAWQNAQNQAIAVARGLATERVAYAELPWMWTDQYGTNMQIIGFPQAWDDIVWRGTTDDPSFIAFYLRQGSVVAANAFNAGREMRHIRRLMLLDVDEHELADPRVRLADVAKREPHTAAR